MKTVKTFSPRTKILSLILSFLIVFYLVPTSVFAEVLEDDTTASDSSVSKNEENSTYTPEIYEVTELREENVKHFHLEDGSYVAAQYNYPVHYTDENGQLADIDNRLIDSGIELSTNNSRVKFIKKITGNGNIFTLHENNTKITMGLVGAEKKTTGVVTSNNNSDDAIESVLGKMTNLENISSTIVYEDTLDGVDIEYIVHSLNIKENIIVKERKDSYSYTFTLDLNNLTANLTESGDVQINSLDGETQYVIPAPIVFDANGTYAPDEAAEYTLSSVGNGKYELNVTVDASWMNDKDRAFPVKIDPTIGVPHNYTTDLDIISSSPNTSYENTSLLRVSPSARSYWRIPTAYLPTLPTTAYIWKAELKLFGIGLNSYVGVYEITSDWDETLTWNKTLLSTPQGAFGSNILDYKKVKANEPEQWYAFDITEAAKKWYNGESNYGVGFKLVEGTDKNAVFYSYEYFDADGEFAEPCFYVYYSDIRGLEDYYSLASHSAGGVGSGSVNLATGNLTLVTDLVSTTDHLMPMTVSAVYNSDMSGKYYTISNSYSAYASSYMPYGFKLNIAETIIEKSMYKENGSLTNYLILLDSDGTNHYFYCDSTLGYIDDSAQGRTINKSTSEITITYKDQSKKTFTKMSSTPSGTTGGWVLSKITDASGNSVIITLDTSYRPTKISLRPNGVTTDIDMIVFAYNGTKLYRIRNVNNNDYTLFSYSGNFLSKITYKNASASSPYSEIQLSYSAGKLGAVQNNTLTLRTEYIWNNNKVATVSEQSNAGLGQQVAFSYGDGYADIRSTGNDEALNTNDDIVNRYIYDIHGRTVSAYSGSVGFTEIYGATMGVYETTPAAKNSIKESTIVYDGKVDYISDGSSLNATLQGGITKTEDTGCYRQVVFEEDDLSTTYNAGMQDIISGFGLSNSITQNENAKFSLSAKVYYYQGDDEGEEDIVVTHHFDFVDVENTWQFVSGKVDCKIDSLSARYNVVRKIELICNYYGQIDANGEASYAEFKNIAFTDCSDYKAYKYSYDVNTGNLVMKSNYAYREYYEYNDKNSIKRLANNKGEIYDYVYQSDGVTLIQEKYYTFNRTGSFQGQLLYDYPFGENNIESKIVKTLVNQTSYSYNNYGLVISSTSTVPTPADAGTVNLSYTYETGSNSKIFGALLTETDSRGYVTKYFYDTSNGELVAQIDVGSGSGYFYDYDDFGALILVLPATGTATSYTKVENAEKVDYTYDTNTNRLSKIATASTEYTFAYDPFGNSSGVTAGNNTLATYEYYQNNGKIKKINYGNGFSEEYEYNSLELLDKIWYNYSDGTRTLAYSYTYNKDGTLQKLENHINGTTIEYTYDFQGRLLTCTETKSSDNNYQNNYVINNYDEDGHVFRATTSLKYLSASVWNNKNIVEDYFYNKNGTLDEEKVFYLPSTGIVTSYSYDNFNRVTEIDRRTDNFTYITSYDYFSDGPNTSSLVGSYTSTVNGTSKVYTYNYDSKGNITSISQGGNTITYTYDDLGQLTKEVSGSTTQAYTYDNAGNITTIKNTTLSSGGIIKAINPNLPRPVTTTTTLSYTNSQWGDLLTSYNGTPIIYDEIGNPLSYYNGSSYTFTWTGRQLTGASKGSTNMSFTYDDNGIRTSKTVNNVKHSYYLNGSQIVAEQWGDKLLVYLYDASGMPIGMMYRTTSYAVDQWDVFWFEKNLQGDIVAVYNSAGTKVATYSYTDAWGNHSVSYTNGGGSTGAQYNPFRYRGYYYDTDLGMYYLQSRYYDAKICRFINADGYVSTGQGLIGNNMFAYCGNNPVMRVDPAGNSWYDWVNTIAGFLNPISTLTAIGDLAVAVAQGRWEDIKHDFNKGCLDPFNQDENVALEAKVLSFYKGSTVVRQGIEPDGACSILGTIWLGTNFSLGKDSVIRHEFGHSVQERLLGPTYLTTIAIPSISYYFYEKKAHVGNIAYYSTPWERTAEFFGRANSVSNYKPNSMGWAIAENILGPVVIPFYFMFGY